MTDHKTSSLQLEGWVIRRVGTTYPEVQEEATTCLFRRKLSKTSVCSKLKNQRQGKQCYAATPFFLKNVLNKIFFNYSENLDNAFFLFFFLDFQVLEASPESIGQVRRGTARSRSKVERKCDGGSGNPE